MSLPTGQAPFDCVEVRLKRKKRVFAILKINFEYGRHCGYCRSYMILELLLNWRIGKIQMKKKGANPDSNDSKIYRKASQKDIDIWSAAREKKNQ
jgi:hypothetical protein